MNGDQPVSWLMMFTLVAGLCVITGAFLFFLRSQRNREIAADALAGDGSGTGVTPHGAGSELIGIGVFALIIMGLLVGGYSSKAGFETARRPAPIGGSGSGGMAQSVGQASQPKQYQPANPAPDLRTAPAASTSGDGPDNGGRPENTTK